MSPEQIKNHIAIYGVPVMSPRRALDVKMEQHGFAPTLTEAIAEIERRNAAEPPEEEHCPNAPGDSRDPSFEPGHRMEYLGEDGGTSFYQCRYCRKGVES